MTDKPTFSDWKALADKEVKGRDLTWHTAEGIDVKPLYTSEDTQNLAPGVPGIAPFTRGRTNLVDRRLGEPRRIEFPGCSPATNHPFGGVSHPYEPLLREERLGRRLAEL